MKDKLLWLGIVFLPSILLLTLALAWTFAVQTDYERRCFDAGGHLYEPERSNLCLTADGRVIEVPR